jgi:hypothetical protein
MLLKFTIDAGVVPVTQQAREDVLNDRLQLLRAHDPNAEEAARQSIREYLRDHNEFTAARIASTGVTDQWQPEFETIYEAFLNVSHNADVAYEEAGKFLGLLVWNEALNDERQWHFTSYPKDDSEFMVTYYFSLDGHIRAKAKEHQAATARAHGDNERANSLEEAARRLREHFRS